MSELKIVHYPSGVLKSRSKEIAKIDKKLRSLIDDMFETMYAADGVGLAAPQVGEGVRVIVVDSRQDPSEKLAIINPEIVSKEGEEVSPEGCLSLPQLVGQVPRAQKVVVKGLTVKGKKLELKAEGFLARVLQHELDHLEGLLIIDRMDVITREMALAEWEQKMKAAVEVKGTA